MTTTTRPASNRAPEPPAAGLPTGSHWADPTSPANPQLTVVCCLLGIVDLDLDATQDTVLRLVATASEEQRKLYTYVIRQVASPTAREAMEKKMTITFRDEFIESWIEQGEIKGEIAGEAAMLLRLLERRFEVTDAIRKRVHACRDTATLEAWFDRATEATTLDAVFAD